MKIHGLTFSLGSAKVHKLIAAVLYGFDAIYYLEQQSGMDLSSIQVDKMTLRQLNQLRLEGLVAGLVGMTRTIPGQAQVPTLVGRIGTQNEKRAEFERYIAVLHENYHNYSSKTPDNLRAFGKFLGWQNGIPVLMIHNSCQVLEEMAQTNYALGVTQAQKIALYTNIVYWSAMSSSLIFGIPFWPSKKDVYKGPLDYVEIAQQIFEKQTIVPNVL